MNPKFEKILKKSMQSLGKAVETVIGGAKKAKTSVKTKSTPSVEPILALESQLPIIKIKELIEVSNDRVVSSLVPNLVDKSSIEICEGPTRYSSQMKEKGSAVTVHVDIGGSAGSYPKDKKLAKIDSVRADIKNIPFEDGFFDYAVANLATARQGDIVKAIQEVGRLITLRGKAIIIDFHPFGRFAKKGSVRLKSMESIVKGVEDYYKICKSAHLSIEYIRESFIDETLRAQFVTDEEKMSFRMVKNTPFLIFMLVSKVGR